MTTVSKREAARRTKRVNAKWEEIKQAMELQKGECSFCGKRNTEVDLICDECQVGFAYVIDDQATEIRELKARLAELEAKLCDA
jgi:hypothetical protein